MVCVHHAVIRPGKSACQGHAAGGLRSHHLSPPTKKQASIPGEGVWHRDNCPLPNSPRSRIAIHFWAQKLAARKRGRAPSFSKPVSLSRSSKDLVLTRGSSFPVSLPSSNPRHLTSPANHFSEPKSTKEPECGKSQKGGTQAPPHPHPPSRESLVEIPRGSGLLPETALPDAQQSFRPSETSPLRIFIEPGCRTGPRAVKMHHDDNLLFPGNYLTSCG